MKKVFKCVEGVVESTYLFGEIRRIEIEFGCECCFLLDFLKKAL
jgi:hypothetical protein